MYRRASKHRETHKGTKRAKCAHVGDTNNNRKNVTQFESEREFARVERTWKCEHDLYELHVRCTFLFGVSVLLEEYMRVWTLREMTSRERCPCSSQRSCSNVDTCSRISLLAFGRICHIVYVKKARILVTFVLLSSTVFAVHSMVCSTFQTSEIQFLCLTVRKLLEDFHTFPRDGELGESSSCSPGCVLLHSLVSSRMQQWRRTQWWSDVDGFLFLIMTIKANTNIMKDRISIVSPSRCSLRPLHPVIGAVLHVKRALALSRLFSDAGGVW